MGWNLLPLNKLKSVCRNLLGIGILSLMGIGAKAQLIVLYDVPPTFPQDSYAVVANNYLQVGVGAGSNVAGAIGVATTQSNPTDPLSVLLEGWNQKGLVYKETEPPYAPYKGGWLYVRVDGGDKAGGADYLWGDTNTDGVWLISPTVVGNHLEAHWETTKATTGTGGKVAANPQIEVDLIVSFIHTTARFEFRVKNRNTSAAHTVGLAFIQDINVSATALYLDGPLRLPNQPYLHHETLLTSALVPTKWETYNLISPATSTTAAQVHSLRGMLKPSSGAQTEPTPPTRFLYGREGTIPNVAGTDLSTGSKKRNFDITWNFDINPGIDPNLVFDSNNTLETTDAATVVFWDPEVVPAGATISKITYFGQADSEGDFTYPMSLSVSAPKALGFVTDKTIPSAPVASVAPNPFVVSAYVQNLSDVQGSNLISSIGPINLYISLPPGLILASGETANKTIADSTPGSEASASWRVMLDPNNPRTGALVVNVSATPNLGNGKTVPVTIEIPAPTTIVLKSNKVTGGLFEMKSFPLNFGGKTPSEVLGLPVPTPTNGVTQQVDVLQWDPTNGHYISQNTWIPGYAYWIRYNPPDTTITTKAFVVNAGLYPPLDGTIQPNAATYKVNYQQGWNQIGDPYVYEYQFSETQVFDNTTLKLYDIITASNASNNLMIPAVYHYDSSDPDPTNWHYTLQENFGFKMQPGEGYWIHVNKANLSFLYPGVDTPGGSVSKAALLGVGLGTTLGRGTDTNWRLGLTTRGAKSTDTLTYVGVAPKATNQSDAFKYPKPPVMNGSVSLDIVHQDWGTNNGRYAQDLRAAGPTVKTWDLTLTSPKPNEDVTITWPGIAGSVPRTYNVTLVDTDSNTRQDMRGRSSYVVNTGTAATRHFQIVAQPTTRAGHPVIASFDVVTNTTSGKAATPTTVGIHYTLSNTAETRVYIRDGRGRTVRTLNVTTRAASDGTGVGETVWDLKDQQGVSLPAGNYQAELVALGADGQRSRMVKPVLIVR